MNLPQEPDLLIERDTQGVIHELRHLQTPAEGDPGASAKRAALEYLQLALHDHLLPLDQADWNHLRDTLNSDGTGRAKESRFRWSEPRELKRDDATETTVVWCQQTASTKEADIIPDVEGGSIRVVAHYRQQAGRWQITSARSTVLPGKLSIKPGDVQSIFSGFSSDWADSLPENVVVDWLGPVLGSGSISAIADARLVAYGRTGPSLVYDDRLGVAASVELFLPMADGEPIAHRILFDPLEKKLIRKVPILSACAGYAFLSDPDSKTGAFTIRSDSGDVLLDPQRDPVSLLDLDHAGGGLRKLSGPRVKVREPAALGADYDPPVQLPPFAFSARTNEFAAVSAYCHCDSMMGLVKGFGFHLHHHFKNIRLPLTVDHRAKMLTGPGAHDGQGINAYVTPFFGTGKKPWNVRMLFGLADFSDSWKHPLGLAADIRFVWHEFCHVLILAATGSTEFDFAHSAGDALGAIMSDPASKLPATWRGVTFPFVQLPLRRHDRKVEQGWGWSGTLYEKPNPTYAPRDPVGYNSEQILSSTLFRLYRATGGDAIRLNGAGEWEPDLERRRAAAYYVAYLIVRAIGSLGSIKTEPTSETSQFATALMDADVGTLDLDYEGSKQRGGMLHKVVRWAFERQGLYQTYSPGQNVPGAPPDIDIYVDDGRHGEYDYQTSWSALPEVLWVQHADGDDEPHESPRPGYVNFVFVIVRNRGAQTAAGTSVDVFAAVDAAVGTWDLNHWQQLQGNNAPSPVPHGGSVRFGPFQWTPQAGKRNALLVRATVPGDRSNIDAGSSLPCATGPASVEALVRADNNLGYREWVLA